MCIRCGEDGHISQNCINAALSRDEQNVLKNMVLGDRDQFLRFCGPEPTMTGTDPPMPATTVGTQPAMPPPVSAHSITYGMTRLQIMRGKVQSAEAFLGEGSGPNKRPHIEVIVLPVMPSVP